MVKVKIAGLTNAEDAAVAGGGCGCRRVCLHKKSPRCAETAAVKAVSGELPPFVLPIGVFVNRDAKVVRDIMDSCGLALRSCMAMKRRPIAKTLGPPSSKPLGSGDRGSFLALAEFQGVPACAVFVDAFSPMPTAEQGRWLIGPWPPKPRRWPVFSWPAGWRRRMSRRPSVRFVLTASTSSGVEARPERRITRRFGRLYRLSGWRPVSASSF